MIVVQKVKKKVNIASDLVSKLLMMINISEVLNDYHKLLVRKESLVIPSSKLLYKNIVVPRFQNSSVRFSCTVTLKCRCYPVRGIVFL